MKQFGVLEMRQLEKKLAELIVVLQYCKKQAIWKLLNHPACENSNHIII